ncbi:carboxypeptidase regulatory-like domain-containing protein [Pedobacter deserti]|uniref:carboxypeptidase regulatory-like domain-containing protein n=1 Tax=Pedobacter deserti TaxID=2817382 RepID=UPI00210B9067|nr:carboxypeptidase regulatory-like domain-containing protein [Pedobacter sp. SYSU D00382]
MKRRFAFYCPVFLYLILISFNLYGQSVHGLVTDTLNKPISYASVNLKASDQSIIAFVLTNENGKFELAVPAGLNTNELSIEVNCIGYQKQSRRLNGTPDHRFVLKTDIQQLKAVEISSSRPKIEARGDTINYSVASFSRNQDRVIGDVLKRMPGIKIDVTGKISYNGKAITNFYIDGDDLLNDRYNLASKSIPNLAVDQVQVLQNHQGVKMLEGKEFSDAVALNLKLKDDAKLQIMGQAKIAGGVPKKYDTEVNAMTFRRSFKAINSIKANNIGLNLENDIQSHQLDQNGDSDLKHPQTQLSIGTVGTPDLPSKRYLMNNAALVNLNNLIKLKEGLQLKLNTYYFGDRQDERYNSQTEILLPEQRIQYDETQNDQRKPRYSQIQTNLNINKKNTYFNNTSKITSNQTSENATIQTNGERLDQRLSVRPVELSNDLNYIFPISKTSLIQFNSNIDYLRQPQHLSILPGYNPKLFNGGIPYSLLDQTIHAPSLLTSHSLSMKHRIGNIFLNYSTGVNYQNQRYRSNLSKVTSEATHASAIDRSTNNVSWTRGNLFAEAGIDIPGKKISLSGKLPFILQRTSYDDPSWDLNHTVTNLMVLPAIRLNYKLINQHSLNFSYRLQNEQGDIEQVYRGYVLRNYRNLSANDAGLLRQINHTASIGFKYVRPEKLFFTNLDIRYTSSISNSLPSFETSQELSRRILLPIHNKRSNLSLNMFSSKYLFFFGVTLSAGPYISFSETEIIQNESLLPYRTNTAGTTLGLDKSISKSLNITFEGNIYNSSSKSPLTSPINFRRLEQSLSVNLTLLENLDIQLFGEHFLTLQENSQTVQSFFSDISGKYMFSKKRIEFELKALNIFNVKQYTLPNISNNIRSISNFGLPGRMIMVKTIFNF